MEEKIMYSLNLTESEFTKLKDALSVLTNIVNNSYVLPRLLLQPYNSSTEIKEFWQKALSSKSAIENTDEIDEPESYANPVKNEPESLPESNDSLLLNIIGVENQNEDSTDIDDNNATTMTEALKYINDLCNKGIDIDFVELSGIKNLNPSLQYIFKDFLKWDIVIHNTFDIREDILVDLLKNMREQDVAFISAIHNISDEFISAHPDLLDWNALLTFNRVPSEKVLFECFKYIPKRYKSNAYKQLICKQMFEQSQSKDKSVDED